MTGLSWHQARAAGLHALPYDIVGYQYRAALWCPGCVVGALPTGPGEAYDGWALAPGAEPMLPEDELSEIAAAFGIDRDDETTYDTDTFPKVLFREHVTDDAYCSGCGGSLT